MNKKQYIIAILCMVSACSPMVDNKGYVKKHPIEDKIIIGQTNKQEVFQQFGSPSSQSSFGEETWYYIHNRKETWGFLAPESVDQDITSIAFNEQGIVTSVNGYTQEMAQEVEYVGRETPTEGHSLGLIEQLLGNVGRFNKPGDNSDTLARGRRPSSTGY